VEERGGKKLFFYYSSLKEVLVDVYPDYPWEPKRFFNSTIPKAGYWKDSKNLMEGLKRVEVALGITKVRLNCDRLIALTIRN